MVRSTMDSDDEMVVVILGDGENGEFPASIDNKTESLNEQDEVEKLIEVAAKHGEYIDFESTKKTEEYDYRNDIEWYEDGDEDYLPESNGEFDDEFGDDDYDYGSENEAHNRRRQRMLEPSQHKSFVKELRDQYPELEFDNNALVTTLAEIMRNIKPPPPPQDYFIMNGIMFECVTCGAISETMTSAARHYQEKHGERYLVCLACGVDFRSTTNLYKHEKRCNARDAVVVLKARARALGRLGRSRPFIPKHLPEETHARQRSKRKFMCSQCSASFVTKTNLHSHELLHRGVRPYVCDDCGSAYTSLAALSRHRKKHSDEQYICDSCGRTFKIKAALITHMDTHLPIKRFGCDQCERRYSTKAALVRHVASRHLKLPPPCVCKICYKRYPRMSMLKEHTKKAHGLLLMTRRMFFKSLPTLTETQIEQAKVVLKSEVEPDGQPSQDIWRRRSCHTSKEQTHDQYTNEVETDDQCIIKTEIDNEVEISDSHYTIECDPSAEIKIEEESIELSEEVLHYLQSLKKSFKDGESYNFMLMQDGQTVTLNLNCVTQSQDLKGSVPVVINGEVNDIRTVP